MYRIINKKKLIATIAADIIGNMLLFPKCVFSRDREVLSNEIRHILVIRTAYIGDVVMTLPILKPLKELYPQARISFLTAAGAIDVLSNNPYVLEVIPFNPFWFYRSTVAEYLAFMKGLRKRRFDLVIEARGDIREILLLARPLRAKYRVSYRVGGGGYLLTNTVPYQKVNHRVEYHMDLVRYLGYTGNDIEWGIYLSDDERKNIHDIMARFEIRRPFIAVHPGSRLPLKRWPAKRYAALCDKLIEKKNMPVVVFGAGTEKPIVEEITATMKHTPVDLSGAVTLREMAGLLSHASVFICNDSAPMHIAAAMKTPTVAIFGPSKSIETGPFGTGHCVVEKDFPCRSTCDESSCRHTSYNACMQDISVNDVFRAADELIRSKEVYVHA